MSEKEGTFWQGVKFRIHNLGHKGWVTWYCLRFASRLLWRAVTHDWSKNSRVEARGFGRLLPLLKESTYGTESYQVLMDEMKPVLQHHYKYNRHHPEYFGVGAPRDIDHPFLCGLDAMTLLDFTEMWCDWQAAVKKHEDGDIFRSIKHNCDRFKMSNQLTRILTNEAVVQHCLPYGWKAK